MKMLARIDSASPWANGYPTLARLVMFMMTFVMFIVPLFPLMTGCQVITNLTTKSYKPTDDSLIVHQPNNTIMSALAQASTGGAGGELISLKMDEQAQKLKVKLKGACVVRVAEGILITLDSRLLFRDDCFELSPGARGLLKTLAHVLEQDRYVDALVEGHTDNIAEPSYNYLLSDKRAQAVADFMHSMGIQQTRIRAKGYGDRQPIAANESVMGQLTNRRIEVALFASDEMRLLALTGELEQYATSKKTSQDQR